MTRLIDLNKIIKCTAIIAVVMMSSCASSKDLAYFQDEPLTEASNFDNSFELKYKPNDILTIDVSALDPDAVRPFNLAAVMYSNNNANPGTTNLSGNGQVIRQTYLVDPNGNIEFPVLGTLNIAGQSRAEVTEMLKERLKDYVKDPIVNIRLINFTVTVLGEVNRPGTFTIQDERISLSEALGLAGDLTIYGKRNNVFLIREEDGKKKYATYDLTSINVVNSPVYYLSQNDVVYVEPNGSRVRQSAYNQTTPVIISAVATLATITAILINNN
ncbi:polysaccharide biosynthesis/export family protein [Psychroserpens sp.]|uniref:polysaccharide biosynthesis/export family protein n=1 Tax=Psychroserpens sp. TaxID=2020870 RepID=UPI001B233C29|nr:polysaccharide biosynthesis/export family protein [Psychroserpens sp.]MBO6606492.1 polysaccharide biosynthesis/export family protein [Psychroserpens sp.]MBO6653196.1 polysaccharide biosynthesis/export family protein [Psychroserpens sp.]MBO6680776.1 polysaccharide biosynthesis/export family protein [Psychroserpens sp.]MBO6750266.1 polysaccharide biosynthesis/export family protein [Psychroserpens sp.]MBO6914747.1 polysaccharide biosynthesis/export family protein [Psychroserpens sp.]